MKDTVVCKRGSSLVIFSLAVGLALPSLAARVPYANDFSTRTSGLSPSDRWMEMPYSTGPIAYSYSTYSYRQPYYKSAEIQDGWAMKGGYCSDKVSFTVADDNGNQGLVWAASAETSDAIAIVHSLGNEFTTGFVKVSVDILTPDATTTFCSGSPWPWVALSPVFRPGLDLEPDAGLSAPLTFGPGYQTDGTSQKLRALAQTLNAEGTSTTYSGRTDANMNITAGRWYRYEAVLNLATRTYRATFADLGTAHPTPQSTGPSKDFYVWYNSVKTYDLPFVTAQSSEVGGIAGLILRVTHVKKNATAGVDNLFVAWRATADEEWTSVYENDFTTRRYRSLGGTTAGAYDRVAHTYALSSTSYGHGTYTNDYGVKEDSCQRLVPDASGSAGSLQPVGVDGWRRIDGKDMKFSLIDPNKTPGGYGWKNATVVRPTVSTSNTTRDKAHGHLVHPIGRELTSGKVRLYFDMMPSRWYAASDTSGTWAGVLLGSAIDAPYQTSSNDAKTILTNKWTCGAGFATSCTKNDYTTGTKWMASSSTDPKVAYTADTTPGTANWYRFKLTADLDAKTYDVQAYVAGTTGPAMMDDAFMTDANKKLDLTGRSFCQTAPAKVDSIILSVWNAAKYGDKTKPSSVPYSLGSYPLIDSIRVCLVNEDGSDGTELYANDFDYCTRNVTVDSAVVGTATDRPGADGWTARGVLQGEAYVAGVNPAVVLNGSNDYSKRILQPLGVTSKGAAEMTVAADIRPPLMAVNDDSNVWVELGGDDYWQGNLASGRAYTDAPKIAFGFAPHTAQAKKSYGYTNLTFAVKSASGVATVKDDTFIDLKRAAHNWYRYRAKIDGTAGTFAVEVYDQGAAQPTAASPDGELVATFADQPLPAFTGKGITTVGLSCYGVVGSGGGDANDPNVALVDNLSVDSVPFGTSLIIR